MALVMPHLLQSNRGDLLVCLDSQFVCEGNHRFDSLFEESVLAAVDKNRDPDGDRSREQKQSAQSNLPPPPYGFAANRSVVLGFSLFSEGVKHGITFRTAL